EIDDWDDEVEITEIPIKPVFEPHKEEIHEPKPLDAIAVKRMEKNIALLKEIFSLVGNDKSSSLIQDGPADYLLVAEIGGYNLQQLKPRHDIIQTTVLQILLHLNLAAKREYVMKLAIQEKRIELRRFINRINIQKVNENWTLKQQEEGTTIRLAKDVNSVIVDIGQAFDEIIA
ncbi:4397_t:CDS:2, partial [Gigaspora margarita]